MKRWKKRWLRDHGWRPYNWRKHEWRRNVADGTVAIRPTQQLRGAERWQVYSVLYGQNSWHPRNIFDDIFPAIAWAELRDWGRL